MTTARCYECPACGGIVRESARTCGYCGSDVATVRCGRCFMMNVTEAAHCAGCGAELGLMPLDASPEQVVRCPRCRERQLDAFSSDGGVVYDCGVCGGQFVTNDVLNILVARHQASAVELPLRLRRNNPLETHVTYRPCPFCSELMLRRNFGKTSGIIVDVCARHGTWFDVGELPRILAFVGQGGLKLAERTEEAERQWLAANSRVPSQAGLGLTSGFGYDRDAGRVSLSDMQEAAVTFVQWAKDFLR